MYRTFTACLTSIIDNYLRFSPGVMWGVGGEGGKELLVTISREASPERGTFFTLQVYETVGLSRVEACMKE